MFCFFFCLVTLAVIETRQQISGILVNTGHGVVFKIDTNTTEPYDDSHLAINITGGPLSYRYRFEEIHIHYGLSDQFGSEHSVQGYIFPAEVSLFFISFHEFTFEFAKFSPWIFSFVYLYRFASIIRIWPCENGKIQWKRRSE